MSRDQVQDEAPLESLEALVSWFERGSTAAEERGIGTEHEKFGYDAATGLPLPWGGPRGISALLETLAGRYGWVPQRHEGDIVAMERAGAAITLEPGGQLELSGAILRTVHETRHEMRTHFEEVQSIAESLGQRWVPTGIQAWDDLDAVEWMPKPRYAIMRRYLPTKGKLAPWMMKMTCTVQANYDYRDLRDAMEMMRLGVLVSPVVSALLANSPVHLGRPNGRASQRMAIWQETDPDRCGVPPFLLDPHASIESWIDWLLDVPMFFLRRDGRYLDVAGASFRRFMRDGLQGHRATLGDFELHLSTVFPEVRLKRYVEVRSADAGPMGAMLAVPALWKGIFYDDTARDAALSLMGSPSIEALLELYRVCREAGCSGSWQGRTVEAIGADLLRIAHEGLDRTGDNESLFLQALQNDDGRLSPPGDAWLSDWHACGGDRLAMQKNWSIARDTREAP